MSTSIKKEKNTKYWINSAIVLFCFFGFGIFPEVFGFTPAAMRAIGIFIGLLWGWITVEFGWVSLLGIIAMGTTGAMTITEAISTSFLSTTFLQLIMPMILFAFMSLSGFSDWFAYKLLAIKSLKGHPWRIITMIFFVATCVCFLISTFPMIFLMWSIMTGIAEVSGYQKGERFVGYMMCGIVMMQSVISASIPWHFYAITLQNLMADSLAGAEMPFIPILVLGIVASILTMFVYIGIGKFILRLDVSKLQELPPDFYEKAKNIKLTKEGKIGLIILAVFILCMCLPSFAPKLPFSPFLKEMGLQGVSIMMLAVLLILRDENGKPYATTSKLAANGLSWELAFLVTSTLSMAALMKAPDVALLSRITGALLPIVTKFSPMMFVVLTIVIFWVITQVTHNFIIVLTLVGALSGVCVQIGIHPWLFGWMFMCTMSLAYTTPAASSPGAMFYGNEWVAKKDAYLCGFLYSFFNLIAFLLIMLPLAKVMFGSL